MGVIQKFILLIFMTIMALYLMEIRIIIFCFWAVLLVITEIDIFIQILLII